MKQLNIASTLTVVFYIRPRKNLTVKYFALCLVCLLASCAFSQKPELVYQTPIEGLEQIDVSEEAGYFITVEDLQLKLWDLNTQVLIAEKTVYTAGKVKLQQDGSVLAQLDYAIAQIDLLNHTEDTLYHTFEEQFIQTYAYSDQFLAVATSETPGWTAEAYKDHSSGKLILIDRTTGEILSERTFECEFTYLSFHGSTLLAASNKGDCLFLDRDLQDQRPKFEFPKGQASRFLAIAKDSMLISNASFYVKEDKRFDLKIGDGSIEFFDLKKNALHKRIALKKDKSGTSKDDFVHILPSNFVHDLSYNPAADELLVLYGHASISTFNTSSYQEKKHLLDIGNKTISLLAPVLSKDQAIISFGENGMFATAHNNFAFVDLNSNRIRKVFSFEVEETDQFAPVTFNNTKVWLGRTAPYDNFGDVDTLEIRTNPLRKGKVFISEEWEIIPMDESEIWVLFNKSQQIVTAVKPKPSLLSRDTTYLTTLESLNDSFDPIKTIHLRNLNLKNRCIEVFSYLDQREQFILLMQENGKNGQKRNVQFIDDQGITHYELKGKEALFYHLAVSQDQKTVVLHPQFNDLKITVLSFEETWNERQFKVETEFLPMVQLDEANNQLYYHKHNSEGKTEICARSLDDLKEETTVYEGILCADFYIDSKTNFLYNACESGFYIVNLSTQELLKHYPGGANTEITYLNKEHRLFVQNDEHSKLIDLATGEIVHLYTLENGAALAYTNEGYYMMEKQVTSKFGFRLNGKGYPYSQFDAFYNRPDLVLDAIGYSPIEELKSYKLAHEKRQRMLGIETDLGGKGFEEVQIPSVIIANKRDIPMLTEKTETALQVKCLSSSTPLKSIQIWVNQVPIYTAGGIDLANQRIHSLDTTLSVALSRGENKIEVATLTMTGIESFKETVYINADYKTTPKTLYFVGIGAQLYQDASLNLSYSRKDIEDVAEIMKTSSTFDAVVIDTLFNSSITLENVKALKQKLQKTNVNDQIILMYSGHGFLDKDYNYFLSTYTIDPIQPEIAGIPYEAFDDLLSGVPARERLVLVDACHSGELDKEELLLSTGNSVIKVDTLAKGSLFKTLHAKTNTFELMRELFADLRRGNGATTISSSSGLYFSYEDNQYRNGLYTHALKEGLLGYADTNFDESVTVTELKDYIYKRVVVLSEGKQKPTSRQENLEFDFRVN